MHGKPIKQQVRYALWRLGKTPEEVAANLELGGWLGLRHDAGACPVARYLAAVLPNASGAEVSRYEAAVLFTDRPDVEANLPRAVADFIEAFDDGAFPELVAQDTDANGDVIDDADR